MPWTAAAPAPSARRRRRGGLIYPPAAGPSSMGLPPQILLIFRFELDGERRRRPGTCFPDRIPSPCRPLPHAVLLRWARRPRGGRIGVWMGGRCCEEGTTAGSPGTGERGGPQTSTRDSRGLQTDSFPRVVSWGDCVKGGRYTVDAITRVPLPHSPGKQDSTRIAWPRGVPTVTIYDGAIVTLCICVN